MITKKWPLVRADQIHVNDPKHPLAILTCWTRKDTVIKMLDEAGIEYNSVGQLYTERGYSPLVRNLLANPNISILVICGKDLSGAGKRLEHDNNDARLIKEWPGLSDIDTSIIAIMLACMVIMRFGDGSLKDQVDLISQIKHIVINPSPWLPQEFPEPEVKTVVFPSSEFGHVVRGQDVPETYLKMLQYILRFGKITDTHYGDPQKEVLAMTNIVENQGTVLDPVMEKVCAIPTWMPENSDHLQEYIMSRILSGKKWPDLKYTYGNLIHDFNGNNQLDQAATKMVDKPDQRSCVISLWDPTEHSKTASGTPCLNHIQFRMRNGKLLMHALIRSNDMFAGFPENAYAMRALQEAFLDIVTSHENASEYILNAELGPMAITSISAHIYKDSWEMSQALVNEYLDVKPWKEIDKKGQLEVRVEGAKIIVELADGRNELQRFEASTAKKMCHLLALNNVTDNISNAMYIAREVTNAEHHIKGFRS